ncbi:MAG: YIP1 family protein [Gammaproteobacteria bacterium]|nr:YIP1 family protein [Gammaproteobacteria bacterium]
MFLKHVLGLFTHPAQEWQAIRDGRCSDNKCYYSHAFILAALPVIAGFYGTTQVGWEIGNRGVIKLTTDSALQISVLYYITLLVGVFTIGKLIQWMGQTYDATQPLSICIALSTYTAMPLFLVGIVQIYPALWLNLVMGLPALAYSVYLLYTGVPVMMDVSKEQGFLFSSAVLAVGLVTLVAILAATVVLWGMGFGPVFTN